jgi:hypothetical protein
MRRGSEQLELELELEPRKPALEFPPAHELWHWAPDLYNEPACRGAWNGRGGLVPELARVSKGLGVAACETCLVLEGLGGSVSSKPLAIQGSRPALCAICLAAPACCSIIWPPAGGGGPVDSCAECRQKRADPRNAAKCIKVCK